MNTKKSTNNILAAVMAIACFFSYITPCQAASPRLHQKLGSDNLAIIQDAKHVTMLQVTTISRKGPLQETHLTADQIERLKRNLLDDHNYNFAKEQQCRFLPELSFKFQTDSDQTLHMFVSLNCNQILFGSGPRTVLLNYSNAEQRLNHFFNELISDAYDKSGI